ncbi:beta/gamma crystallin-related protein [Mesorhizobium sp. M1365]|uniref:beta/gamma crystallin-related protein n=1 Tax=Mesorhizobium sp. M1365 TaxID=2957090 RepID=UPI0033380361
MLTQNRDDLLFRKPLSLHQSVLQSRPDSNLRWRKLPVAGHDNWNDETSSFIVDSGHWISCEHTNFQGLQTQAFGPGRYPSCTAPGFLVRTSAR